jgi:hypothetical protein
MFLHAYRQDRNAYRVYDECTVCKHTGASTYLITTYIHTYIHTYTTCVHTNRYTVYLPPGVRTYERVAPEMADPPAQLRMIPAAPSSDQMIDHCDCHWETNTYIYMYVYKYDIQYGSTLLMTRGNMYVCTYVHDNMVWVAFCVLRSNCTHDNCMSSFSMVVSRESKHNMVVIFNL